MTAAPALPQCAFALDNRRPHSADERRSYLPVSSERTILAPSTMARIFP
jgi:hypothetical protein